jgi:maleylpyruvate isomerase
MSGSDTSQQTSVAGNAVGPARVSGRDMAPPMLDATAAQRRAEAGLAMNRVATARLIEEATALDDVAMKRPTLLPEWTRAHVIAHLARNADGLLNLLTWARTGVEHQMYTSRADRDAAIEEGARQLAQVLHEDLIAACDRFDAAADNLQGASWQAQVVGGHGRPMTACEITWARWVEVSIHLVDLDCGAGFGELPQDHLEPLLDVTVRVAATRQRLPAMRLTAELPDDRRRSWMIGEGTVPTTIEGTAGPMIGWLTGRSDGSDLVGRPPQLPAWA